MKLKHLIHCPITPTKGHNLITLTFAYQLDKQMFVVTVGYSDIDKYGQINVGVDYIRQIDLFCGESSVETIAKLEDAATKCASQIGKSFTDSLNNPDSFNSCMRDWAISVINNS